VLAPARSADSVRAPAAACWGASELPNGAGAWLRVLAGDVAVAMAAVTAGWHAARRILLGAYPPRSRRY
jgi:urease accessory protein